MNTFNTENYYKTNVIIWSAIMIGMILLIIMTYFLDIMRVFQPLAETLEMKNIFFAFILIAALAVLFLKRSLLDFNKIYSKVQNIHGQDKKPLYLSRLRSNYIIIWALSESIIMFGFVEYVLVCDFKSFLLYAVIGLYAVAINFPRRSIFEQHLQLLAEKEGFNINEE